MYTLGVRSKARLKGVHPDLVKVVERAINLTTVDFTVLEGVRDPLRQMKLVEAGASQTMNSRHIPGAGGFGVPIEWGGDWRTFKDGPHFQLPKKEYP